MRVRETYTYSKAFTAIKCEDLGSCSSKRLLIPQMAISAATEPFSMHNYGIKEYCEPHVQR